MQSLEHRALAQTARTQFKERQQSMARFRPSHLHSGHNPDFGLPPSLAGHWSWRDRSWRDRPDETSAMERG